MNSDHRWLLVLLAVFITGCQASLRMPTLSQDDFLATAPNDVLAVAPPFSLNFLGSHERYASGFDHHRKNASLASGDGRINGIVTANAEPVAGLTLRLALNGSVMSQWGTTDQDGHYFIAVPAGQYRIDGYELDRDTAEKTLAGKIDRPGRPIVGQVVSVEAGKVGFGLAIEYVDPVIKIGPTGEVSVNEEIVARWQPYPGASSYLVQLYEAESQQDYYWKNQLYDWDERPNVAEAMISLTALGVGFNVDHYYSLEIVALDGRGRSLSKTPRIFQSALDFKIVE